MINKSGRKYKQLLICSLGFLSLTVFSSFKSPNRIICRKHFSGLWSQAAHRRALRSPFVVGQHPFTCFFGSLSRVTQRTILRSSCSELAAPCSSTLFLVISLLRTMLHPVSACFRLPATLGIFPQESRMWATTSLIIFYVIITVSSQHKPETEMHLWCLQPVRARGDGCGLRHFVFWGCPSDWTLAAGWDDSVSLRKGQDNWTLATL